MNNYELMYILDVSLEDTARKEQIEKYAALIAANGGTVQKIDEMGKRRLAYPIDFKNEGYYVLMTFSAPPALPREIERNLQISDSVLRYLIVKLEQKTTSVKPRAARAVAVPVAPAVSEAPKAPEAAEAPEATEATEAPKAPEAAEAPEAPEAEEANGAIEADGGETTEA